MGALRGTPKFVLDLPTNAGFDIFIIDLCFVDDVRHAVELKPPLPQG